MASNDQGDVVVLPDGRIAIRCGTFGGPDQAVIGVCTNVDPESAGEMDSIEYNEEITIPYVNGEFVDLPVLGCIDNPLIVQRWSM